MVERSAKGGKHFLRYGLWMIIAVLLNWEIWPDDLKIVAGVATQDHPYDFESAGYYECFLK